MTTTMVRDSIVGDAWIQATAAAVPVQRIIDQATGQPTGDILTGPVRLAFTDLFELPKPKKLQPGQQQSSEPKYGATLLFPPTADFTILYEEYYKLAGQHFADKYDPQTQQYYGIRSPFRNQAEKLKFGGYTPNCTFMTCTSKFKPPVVDARFNPIVDRNKVYPGVWAICAVNAYHYPNPVNPGIAFGLQSVMIIGDDQKFGQGGPDAKTQFAGVNVAAPIIRPDIAAGMSHLNAQAGAPAPAAGIPGYTAPGGGVARPMAPGAAPTIPQTHYQPQAPAETEEQRLMREMGIG